MLQAAPGRIFMQNRTRLISLNYKVRLQQRGTSHSCWLRRPTRPNEIMVLRNLSEECKLDGVRLGSPTSRSFASLLPCGGKHGRPGVAVHMSMLCAVCWGYVSWILGIEVQFLKKITFHCHLEPPTCRVAFKFTARPNDSLGLHKFQSFFMTLKLHPKWNIHWSQQCKANPFADQDDTESRQTVLYWGLFLFVFHGWLYLPNILL